MGEKMTQETFLPGEYILDELKERGWSQTDLSDILGYSPTVISETISGKRTISIKFAQALAEAFGTSAQLWLNLQNAYDLTLVSSSKDIISRRAKLYAKAPIREMIRRRWIEKINNIEILEKQVCKFLEIENIDDEVKFAYAARKSDDYNTKPNPIQTAWLMRAKMLAPAAPLMELYNERNFKKLIEELAPLRLEPEAISQVPKILRKYGIRFLLIEYLPQAKIDGACFWLDSQSPVIALSMRFDRIDYFWFTLMHDLFHIKNRPDKENPLLETLVIGEDAQPSDEKPQEEKRADEFAAGILVNQKELHNFMLRHQRLYSEKSIIAFAKVNRVHPGIVVGQLHYRRAFHWKYFRTMLTKVREYITDTALTDGWGKIIVK
jgi:HTH-type transcriptional regulator / antitoxin HigA